MAKVVGDTLVMSMEEFTGVFESRLKAIQEKLEENIEWFTNLWERDANRYDFYELALAISPNIKPGENWERGWSYTLVLSENFEVAKMEFVNLILGWY